MDIVTIVALIIAGISAIATVVIAVFTYKTIRAYEKQVQIGQDHMKMWLAGEKNVMARQQSLQP